MESELVVEYVIFECLIELRYGDEKMRFYFGFGDCVGVCL